MRKPKRRLNILVTAGATREALDPVRFISNYATGFFGEQLSRQARKRGHRVILIEARGNAEKLRTEIKRKFNWCDCLVMTAAVCDFRPVAISKAKIKRNQKGVILKLKQNPDILRSLGRRKRDKILVGFALETENLKQNAQEKLRAKKLDLILATQMNGGHPPFGRTKINALLLDKNGSCRQLKQVSKGYLSRILLEQIENW
jgi:phosphopantothenoylcysteine decarboxylase/phosphopantothenate--cysteine ligase